LLEDLVDSSFKNDYIVALGFVFDSIPYVGEVVIVPKSKLERYKRGDYEWQVIEAEQLPPSLSKSDMQEALARMCEKYGSIQYVGNTINVSHKERIRVSNEIAEKLIQIPYVHSVFLTGSTAISLDRDNSDVDLLVVLANCPGTEGHSDLDKLTGGFHSITEILCIPQEDFLIAQNYHLQHPLIRDRSLIVSK
jgi:hypothetical protein